MKIPSSSLMIRNRQSHIVELLLIPYPDSILLKPNENILIIYDRPDPTLAPEIEFYPDKIIVLLGSSNAYAVFRLKEDDPDSFEVAISSHPIPLSDEMLAFVSLNLIPPPSRLTK